MALLSSTSRTFRHRLSAWGASLGAEGGEGGCCRGFVQEFGRPWISANFQDQLTHFLDLHPDGVAVQVRQVGLSIQSRRWLEERGAIGLGMGKCQPITW
jgi:hypothetical protein